MFKKHAYACYPGVKVFHRIIKPSFKRYICDVILNLYELDKPWITAVSQNSVIGDQN